MTTPKRAWYPGLSYHITTRGNRKEIIFRELSDFKVYLMILKETLEYYKDSQYKIICFCLMTNHVHLVLKCNDKEPGHFMRMINSKYAIYFNSKYDYVGHLFQGRYHSEAITNTNHLLETSKYIHMNPVKANIVNSPEEYIWSSYKLFINKTGDWISKNKGSKFTINKVDIEKGEVLKYFKNSNAYINYVIAPGERK